MGSEWEKERRLAALCKRMGDMWSEEVVVNVFEKMPEEKVRLCDMTLLGKLYSRPNVNIPAFVSTMKRAWRVENMVCDPIEGGLFSFTFTTESDQMRILEESPWSFSNNLLILQQLNPKVPIHRHDFSHCAFWVQILGLPLAMITEHMLKQIGSNMGKVTDLKMEAKGGSLCKVGKVRVLLDLSKPLKSGMVINSEDDQLWVDFRYERLPLYCYSCGKIGHFTTKCETIPYKDEETESLSQKNYGYWLRAEARQRSPFWKLFNDGEFQEEEEEEVVPETQNPPDSSVNPKGVAVEIQPLAKVMPMEGLKRKGVAVEEVESRLKTPCSKEKQLMIMDTPWIEEPAEMVDRHTQRKERGAGYKKMKRSTQKTAAGEAMMQIDEAQLCETPIRFEEDSEKWALVASPNKPPGIR